MFIIAVFNCDLISFDKSDNVPTYQSRSATTSPAFRRPSVALASGRSIVATRRSGVCAAGARKSQASWLASGSRWREEGAFCEPIEGEQATFVEALERAVFYSVAH